MIEKSGVIDSPSVPRANLVPDWHFSSLFEAQKINKAAARGEVMDVFGRKRSNIWGTYRCRCNDVTGALDHSRIMSLVHLFGSQG